MTLISAVTNQLERPVFLPRIDPAGTVQVVAGQATVVANPNLGITMTVAADTAFLNGQPFLGALSISEVPLEFAPMALPEELGFAQLISIQPTGVTFSQPAPITFPNLDNMAPGSEVDIYSLDPDTGTFTIVGVGTVSADGTLIETTSGGITAATWHATLDRLLERLRANKDELLVVLERPDIPLHTNVSENDIRCQVTRRKVSGGTRSDAGRDCRDAFPGLMKTCAKLGIRFRDYLGNRLKVPDAPAVRYLPDLVRQQAASI